MIMTPFIISAERSLNTTPEEYQALSTIREPDSGEHDDSGAGKQLSPLRAGTKNPETGTNRPKIFQSQRAITSRQKRSGNGHVVRNGHVLPHVMAAADWPHRGLQVTFDGDGHRSR